MVLSRALDIHPLDMLWAVQDALPDSNWYLPQLNSKPAGIADHLSSAIFRGRVVKRLQRGCRCYLGNHAPESEDDE